MSTTPSVWYTSEDTETHCIDFDDDPQNQLSLMLKPDGSVVYAAYFHGHKACGQASGLGFMEALARFSGVKAAEELANCRMNMKAVWDYLQKVSPWSPSSDMEWCSEIITGIDMLRWSPPAIRIVLIDGPGGIQAIRHWDNLAYLPAGEYFLHVTHYEEEQKDGNRSIA